MKIDPINTIQLIRITNEGGTIATGSFQMLMPKTRKYKANVATIIAITFNIKFVIVRI